MKKTITVNGKTTEDLEGLEFGSLKVLRFHGFVGALGRPAWICLCKTCERETDPIHASNLKSGKSTSCKRCRDLKFRQSTIKHGKSKTPVYGIWKHIHDRCYNPNSEYYRIYGAMNVVMCDRYRGDFEAFEVDLGPRPVGKTVDRYPDKNGSYTCGKCPECLARGWNRNVRWATRKEQAQNRRNNKMVTIGPDTKPLSAWCDIYKQNIQLAWDRMVKLGWGPLEALTTPPGCRPRPA